MKLVTCHAGKLRIASPGESPWEAGGGGAGMGGVLRTGLSAWDGLAPGGGLARGAVHELIAEEGAGGPPLTAAAVVVAAALAGEPARFAAWCDRDGELYPPALAAAGIDLSRLLLVRPPGGDERLGAWAMAECLRCRAIAVTVACASSRLTRLGARRLQLAAEAGGGVGLLLRPARAALGPAAEHAAATRWLIGPRPGERTLQRWSLQLIHGHGGRLGRVILLEVCRETGAVRASEPAGDRSGETEATARRA